MSNHRESIVDELMRNGRYSSASEVVEEGLRLVEEQEKKLQWLRSKINKAINEGETLPKRISGSRLMRQPRNCGAKDAEIHQVPAFVLLNRRNTRLLSRIALAFAATVVLAAPASAQTASPEASFRRFLDTDIWPAAKARGVPRGVFDEAFRGVKPNLKLPDLVLPGEKPKIEEKSSQAEFRDPAAYFDDKSLTRLAAKGRTLLADNRATLATVERRYGVPAPILLAIWAKESNFGAAKIPYDAFEVLGTKAWASRRKEMFREELLAALDIVADGHLKVSEMRSSWAGALGQPQFMPSKFKDYAVDFDGDGRRDIWRSTPDTLASIAHYLQASGWQAGRGWGAEASVPASLSCTGEGPDKGRPVSDLAKAGAASISKAGFGKPDAKAHLMMPAGRMGPAFVATPNFYTIKVYNNSDLYALFIGQLADRIAGTGGAFKTPWRTADGLSRGQTARLQEKLIAKGYDVGGADGFPGFKTRRSIGEAERTLGMPETCWPNAALASKL
ncbi:type II toxin-antitoxin system ParD family antitoxin [Aureimonas psammosilenae]|uniref:type II toxin-antitoxin system ParD family antitoxin n=1 Tax=Aureimonas psammosilenae TaxID=2495496 RepID=UPI00186A0E7A|nr:type II toxin-antitoxin system ParD family antitoxin [Aureimonas psammosilenae]